MAWQAPGKAVAAVGSKPRPTAPAKTAAALALAALLASSVFLLCYRYDNKYTAKGRQPLNGVLTLTDDTLEQSPMMFLIWDWELYRGRLLGPQDFAPGAPAPDEYTFIGQYKGFEGGDRGRSPHGSATYRLQIRLPAGARSYTLELPEIFSAYRLYINGVLMGQMGEPQAAAYLPRTGITSVSLLAEGHMEIILAVSDFSYLYSGMIYPPAFGLSPAVADYMNTRLALRVAAIGVAACVGLLALCIRVMTGRGQGGDLLVLYTLLCVCFVGYIGYPVVKTLFHGGLGWYYFANLCRVFMFLLVILIQHHVSGFGGRAIKAYVLFALFVCGFCVMTPVLLGGNLGLMLAYSRLLEIYTYASAVFLTASTVYGLYKNTIYSVILLSGAVVFDCALVLWRIYPSHEPIILGRFGEMASGLFVVLISVVIAAEIARQYGDKLALQQQVEGTAKVIEMQNAYYPVLLEKEHQLKEARHDLRHHFVVLRQLAQENNFSGLIQYIDSYAGTAFRADALPYCGHYAIDMLLRLYGSMAGQAQIQFSARADVPAHIGVSDVDLCVIISNILENAVEAARGAAGEHRWVRLYMLHGHSRLSIVVDNGFDGVLNSGGGKLLSRKGRHRVGLGLSSVASVAKKYNGHTSFYADEASPVFHSEVILALGE